ncbi:MAG TPA: DUF885 family protein [Gemmatimonadales bacterium]|nr:DUF885 family protein [Gemmatimonadales bacterium]
MNARALCVLMLMPVLAAAQERRAAAYVPDLATSDMRDVVSRFSEDQRDLLRRYDDEYSPERRQVLRDFYAAWVAHLNTVDFNKLGEDARVDWILLRTDVVHEQALLDREKSRLTEVKRLIPFADTIFALEDARRRLEFADPAAAGRTLAWLAARVSSLRPAGDSVKPTKVQAYHAWQIVRTLKATLASWYKFYDGYDPLFTWWAKEPYAKTDSALDNYAKTLRQDLVGWKPGDDEPIVGLPIGRDGLMADLRQQMIPYTPEELIAIARREFAWCRAQMIKAARDMGLGDDWRAALEKVKQDNVAPGQQTALARDLAREAVAYVQQHDLVTVPPLAQDMYRMEMLSPQAQKESPFFLGGPEILVSYPTDAMTEEDKLMSMRGNNRHFSRATVFHELIPGHELQGFMNSRYNPQRREFYTPFYIEGNSFYWETLLWDLDFTHTPEDRVGALFWRMHRAARIIFSLNFHLGNWTPQQAIDFLVDSVGHERANATAEVRRSFNGDYSPLYQVAYMIGGLQFRALHHELVDGGKMTNQQFHDAILHQGPIPLEMVRAELENLPLKRDFVAGWKFADELPPNREP